MVHVSQGISHPENCPLPTYLHSDTLKCLRRLLIYYASKSGTVMVSMQHPQILPAYLRFHAVHTIVIAIATDLTISSKCIDL